MRRGLGQHFRLVSGIIALIPFLGAFVGPMASLPLVDMNSGIYTLEQEEHGAKVYAMHCAACHGATLTGGGGPTLSGPFWAAWNGRSISELFQLIQGSMPQDAPSSLSDEDYAAIIAHMLKTGGYPAGTQALPASTDALGSIKIGPRS